MRNALELAKNTVSKSPIVFKVFLKKVFELSLYYWVFVFGAAFMLMPLLNYCFAKKHNGKKNLIEPVNSCDFKIIFIPIVEKIAIQLSIPIIQVGKQKLKKVFAECRVCLKLAMFLNSDQ